MPKGHEKELSKTYLNESVSVSKDTRGISNTLHILDSHVVKTNPFGVNVSGDNSYRRAERLSAALHLITNHVPENEPLRFKIRTSSIELLALILDLRLGFRTPSSEKGQAVLAAIRELVSLVRLLAVAGYVSAENVNAIAEALDELGSLIVVSQRSTLAEQMTVTRDDLIPPAHQSVQLGTESRRRRNGPKLPRRNIKDITDKTRLNMSIMADERASQILDILKLGGVLGIRDISANLPQYSEKMIQRELVDLVLAHKVTKIGAKRWSRYQIAFV